MDEIVLESEARTKLGTRNSRRLRKEGIIPITLCVPGKDSAHLQVDVRKLTKVLRTGARIVTLVHPGGKDRAFVKEIQYDHLGDKVYHVDLNRVAMDEALELEVDLVLKGKPLGVVEGGGILDQYVKTLRISCLPDAIPERIEADVSELNLNDNLTLKNLTSFFRSFLSS